MEAEMDLTMNKSIKIFYPRSSHGWVSLILMAVIIFAIAIAPALVMGLSSGSVILTVAICSVVALAFLVLAFWFPTMRYELGQDELILRYGPALRYRIALSEIRTIRHRNLSLTIWSSVRFPGIALFTVPYADVGNVRMCSTAALNNILLIETEKEKYGLTPAKEDQFVAALRTQMGA